MRAYSKWKKVRYPNMVECVLGPSVEASRSDGTTGNINITIFKRTVNTEPLSSFRIEMTLKEATQLVVTIEQYIQTLISWNTK